MAIIIIKYFTLFFYGFYVYIKILNHITSATFKKVICTAICVPASIGFGYLVFLLNDSIPFASIFLIIPVMALFMLFLFGDSYRLALTAMLISMGISYALFFVSDILAVLLNYLAMNNKTNYNLMLIVAFFIQGALAVLLFRIDRLKNGISFLKGEYSSTLGIFYSIILLLFIVLARYSGDFDLVSVLITTGIVICTICIFSWWRRGLTHLYVEKQREKELKSLYKELANKDQQIKDLLYHNNYLSKIIHKDNKLIPAMEFTIREFLIDRTEDDTGVVPKGNALLQQLSDVVKERKGIIKSYQDSHKKLPSTQVLAIDSILSYMFNKAKEKRVNFDLVVSGDISFLIKNYLKENEIQTLLADLIDNALHSLDHCDYKCIRVILGLAGDFYELTVEDSGKPFDYKVYRHMGAHHITTNYGDIGGIGIMTMFEILRSTRASLIICEPSPALFSITKRIIVRFDNRMEFRVQSYRIDEIKKNVQRPDIVYDCNTDSL